MPPDIDPVSLVLNGAGEAAKSPILLQHDTVDRGLAQLISRGQTRGSCADDDDLLVKRMKQRSKFQVQSKESSRSKRSSAALRSNRSNGCSRKNKNWELHAEARRARRAWVSRLRFRVPGLNSRPETRDSELYRSLYYYS